MKKEFGRIVDGEVVETGVSETHLGNRDKTGKSIYLPVYTVVKPGENENDRFDPEYTIGEDHILRTWKLVKRDQNDKERFMARREKNQKEAFEKQVKKYLDEGAKEAGYDSILSACSYAVHPNKYQHEGIGFVEWRSSVWEAYYLIMNDIKTGQRPKASFNTIKEELPKRSDGKMI